MEKKRAKSRRRVRSKLPRAGSRRKAVRHLALGIFAAGFLWTGLMRGAVSFNDPRPSDPLSESTAVEGVSNLVAAASQGATEPFDRLAGALETNMIDSTSETVEWDLPNLQHERVDYWVERFTTDKSPDFGRFLQRKGRYESMIREKLADRGMPQDLLYLAMIESGFQAKAYSPAHAAGIWQFMAPTGKQYGLDINRAVDERNDPEKATDAALDYLSYLHDRFDSWYLAAASYNTGPNRVGRIMRKVTGSEKGSEEAYYRIWDHLPKETRDYVPLMVAAARISKEPERYGFNDVEPDAPPRVKVVRAAPATPLSVIARREGTTVSQIRELNPHFKLDRTRNDMESSVRIPVPVQIASR